MRFCASWSPFVRLGGNVNNGSNAGVLYFNANNAVSNANWNYGGGSFLYASLRTLTWCVISAFTYIANTLAHTFSEVAEATEIHPTGTAQ